jgi:hypothetical protein
MNTAALVQQDDDGLYVLVGTRKFRPGPVTGFEQLPMDSGGVRLRQVVRLSPSYYQDRGLIAVVTPRGQRIWSGLPADDDLRVS